MNISLSKEDTKGVTLFCHFAMSICPLRPKTNGPAEKWVKFSKRSQNLSYYIYHNNTIEFRTLLELNQIYSPIKSIFQVK
jgi:hypothetical protein